MKRVLSFVAFLGIVLVIPSFCFLVWFMFAVS